MEVKMYGTADRTRSRYDNVVRIHLCELVKILESIMGRYRFCITPGRLAKAISNKLGVEVQRSRASRILRDLALMGIVYLATHHDNKTCYYLDKDEARRIREMCQSKHKPMTDFVVAETNV